jgi:hypothetical protein
VLSDFASKTNRETSKERWASPYWKYYDSQWSIPYQMVAEQNRELRCEFCGAAVKPPVGDDVLFCGCGAEYRIGVVERCNGHERKVVYNYDPQKRCVVDGFSSWATEELSKSGLVPVTFLRNKDGKVQAKLDEIADSIEDIL